GHIQDLETEGTTHSNIQIEIFVYYSVVPACVIFWQPIAYNLLVIGLLIGYGLWVAIFTFNNPIAVLININGLKSIEIAYRLTHLHAMGTLLNRFTRFSGIKVTASELEVLIR